MARDTVVGKEAGAYYNTASYATPTWVEITKAIDVSVNLGKNTATVASRDVDWELAAPALKTASVDIGYLHTNVADTVFDALLSMYINDDVKDMFISDASGGVSTGDQGLRAHFICTDMSQEQALQDSVEYSFSFQPTRFNDSGTLRVPEWFEAS